MKSNYTELYKFNKEFRGGHSRKKEKGTDFKGKIDIEFNHNNDYIEVKFKDNGVGIKDYKSDESILYYKKRWYRTPDYRL